MALETRNGRGVYYTRSHKVNGRVTREYVASGQAAILIAEYDQLERQHKREDRRYEQWQLEDINSIDSEIKQYNRKVDRLMHAYLITMGYHQHDRGQWRRQRAKSS